MFKLIAGGRSSAPCLNSSQLDGALVLVKTHRWWTELWSLFKLITAGRSSRPCLNSSLLDGALVLV